MWTTIKRLFDKTLHSLWAFLKEIIRDATEQILAQLKDAAYEIVRNISLEDLSNEDKRKKAFEHIKIIAKAKGLEVRDSLVYLLIELTLQKIKKDIK